MSNHLDHTASDINYQTAVENGEHALFALLKPTLKRDGDQWCVLYGESIQDGVCGVGRSPNLAVIDFNKSWYAKLEEGE